MTHFVIDDEILIITQWKFQNEKDLLLTWNSFLVNAQGKASNDHCTTANGRDGGCLLEDHVREDLSEKRGEKKKRKVKKKWLIW